MGLGYGSVGKVQLWGSEFESLVYRDTDVVMDTCDNGIINREWRQKDPLGFAAQAV